MGGEREHLGDGGGHDHLVDPLEIAKAVGEVAQLAESYRDSYYQLKRGLLQALRVCGDCQTCWEEWSDHDGVPSDTDTLSLVGELVRKSVSGLACSVVSDSSLTSRSSRAVNMALDYDYIDGDHHKQWVIDQMLRELLGVNYQAVIADHVQAVHADDGNNAYHWSVGIAP